uniref:Avd-like protein n=1 Tax=Siphoviridae sp. cty3u30 TaxID=2825744 RepID=A0A8S5Q7J7_9CAUD|nr:MAG TPA: Avd-like protein [Siphoviridae sp. cty3u30]
MIDGEKNFALCEMVDELLSLTLELCDRDSKRPRTPKRLHRSLVDRIILTACAIQEETILANETELVPQTRTQRLSRQKEAMRRCVVLRHQARILAEKGYISDKQRERWQKLTVAVYWKLYAWAKADSKR